MAAARRSKPRARARAKRSSPSLPVLEQHHLDLLGLGLVALSVFLGFVLYGDWEGGRAGSALIDGLGWAVGEARFLAPVAFAATGAILVLRPVLPAVRPFRSGALCLFAALTLALAAGTLGLGPGAGDVRWDRLFVSERGGLAGEGLYWVASTLFSDVGAHIIAVFLFLAAVLLLSGATVAGVLKATGTHVAETTRALRPQPQQPARRKKPMRPPEPDFEEPVVTRLDPEDEAAEPDAFPEAEIEEPEPDPVVDDEEAPADVTQIVAPEQLPPMGRYRREVTDD